MIMQAMSSNGNEPTSNLGAIAVWLLVNLRFTSKPG